MARQGARGRRLSQGKSPKIERTPYKGINGVLYPRCPVCGVPCCDGESLTHHTFFCERKAVYGGNPLFLKASMPSGQ